MNKKISVTCPHCNKTYELDIKGEYFGKTVQIKCVKCSQQFKKVLPKIDANEVEADSTFINPSVSKGVQCLRLEVVGDENARPQVFMINQEYTIIGRKNDSGPEYKPDVEIETKDGYMSRKHCVIQRTPRNQFTIKDNGAKNRTWLNNKSLSEVEKLYLKNGDDIRIGHTHLKVTLINTETGNDSGVANKSFDSEETTI